MIVLVEVNLIHCSLMMINYNYQIVNETIFIYLIIVIMIINVMIKITVIMIIMDDIKEMTI